MGCYINPETETKEEFLRRVGTPLQEAPKWDEIPKGSLAVCWVNNGPFSAAGVAFDERELEAFMVPEDRRPKKWFIVTIEDLRGVCPLEHYYTE